MDFAKMLDRVKNILLSPKSEWAVIAAEPATVQSLLTYAVILAGLAGIAGLIGMSFVGVFGIRLPVGLALANFVVSLLLTIGLCYLMGMVVSGLAPSFSGEKSLIQGLKTIVFASTPVWVAQILSIIPALGLVAALAGLVWAIYLLYIGLPQTMKSPPERSGGYTAVTIIIYIVLGWIVGMIAGLVTGTSAAMKAAMQSSLSG